VSQTSKFPIKRKDTGTPQGRIQVRIKSTRGLVHTHAVQNHRNSRQARGPTGVTKMPGRGTLQKQKATVVTFPIRGGGGLYWTTKRLKKPHNLLVGGKTITFNGRNRLRKAKTCKGISHKFTRLRGNGKGKGRAGDGAAKPLILQITF